MQQKNELQKKEDLIVPQKAFKFAKKSIISLTSFVSRASFT